MNINYKNKKKMNKIYTKIKKIIPTLHKQGLTYDK